MPVSESQFEGERMEKRNQLIDCARVFFAASIVMLHVPHTNEFVNWYSSTVSRLGVPFFFLIAGYFGVRGGITEHTLNLIFAK